MTDITKKTQDQAEKIKNLMAEGKTLEEALSLTSQKAKKDPIDRIAYIQGLNNIAELRKARKTAYAKKSKSKDKPETLARYQQEIDVATDRLNTLISEVTSAEVPWQKALELGETPEGAIQYFLGSIEKESEDYLREAGIKKSILKTLLQNTVIHLEFVPTELAEAFQKRIDSRDQRVRAAAVRYQLMTDLKAGTVKVEEAAPEVKVEEPKAPKASKGKKVKKETKESEEA
jgi:hypothetical protein